jgi:PAS domain S-box-containing protein
MPEGMHRSAPEGQLFYNAFKASPIGIAVENLEGQPLFANPALCAMLGFTEEEMRGKRCVEFSPPEDAQKDWALFQRLRAGDIKHYQIEKRFIRRDGSLLWGYLSISLLNDPSSPLVVAMVEDITDKKTLEDREQGASQTLDLVTKQMAAAVTRCSRDFRYLWVSQAYADWLQRPFDEIVDRPIVEVLGQDAFLTLLPYFKRVLAGEKVQYEQEMNYRTIGKRWVLATYTPTFDVTGTCNGWVGVGLDITERKLTEQSLATMAQKLVAAHEEERRRIARELHDDINQRVALVSATLENMRQDLASSRGDLEQQIADAHRQLEELGSEVQALSHRLHSSKLEYLGLVASCRSFLTRVSDRHNITVRFDSHDIPTTLPGDIALSLYRVLQEAVQNAVKHSGAREFLVSLTREANEIELTVQDSGCGFVPEEAFKGSGLGLTSMKERVRLIGGTLSIDSQLRRGTTIRARVPLGGQAKSASVGN